MLPLEAATKVLRLATKDGVEVLVGEDRMAGVENLLVEDRVSHLKHLLQTLGATKACNSPAQPEEQRKGKADMDIDNPLGNLDTCHIKEACQAFQNLSEGMSLSVFPHLHSFVSPSYLQSLAKRTLNARASAPPCDCKAARQHFTFCIQRASWLEQ